MNVVELLHQPNMQYEYTISYWHPNWHSFVHTHHIIHGTSNYHIPPPIHISNTFWQRIRSQWLAFKTKFWTWAHVSSYINSKYMHLFHKHFWPSPLELLYVIVLWHNAQRWCTLYSHNAQRWCTLYSHWVLIVGRLLYAPRYFCNNCRSRIHILPNNPWFCVIHNHVYEQFNLMLSMLKAHGTMYRKLLPNCNKHILTQI